MLNTHSILQGPPPLAPPPSMLYTHTAYCKVLRPSPRFLSYCTAYCKVLHPPPCVLLVVCVCARAQCTRSARRPSTLPTLSLWLCSGSSRLLPTRQPLRVRFLVRLRCAGTEYAVQSAWACTAGGATRIAWGCVGLCGVVWGCVGLCGAELNGSRAKGASKFAVEALTKSLAQALPEGMAAIPFSPGVVHTEMNTNKSAASAAQWVKDAAPRILAFGSADNGKSLVMEKYVSHNNSSVQCASSLAREPLHSFGNVSFYGLHCVIFEAEHCALRFGVASSRQHPRSRAETRLCVNARRSLYRVLVIASYCPIVFLFWHPPTDSDDDQHRQ
jgi:hypothetical protein